MPEIKLAHGALFIGEEGVLLLPHMGGPRLFPQEKFQKRPRPKLQGQHHYHQFIDVDHLVDMLSVRKTLGESVALSGNIDPVAGVLRGTPHSIVAYVQETYQQVGNPFFVNAGCEIPSGTPIENIKALCEPLDWRA